MFKLNILLAFFANLVLASSVDKRCGNRPYEVYVDCPDYLCRPQTCNEVGYSIYCPVRPHGKHTCCQGVRGCYCAEGYVRDDTGKCISTQKCPSCGGDENAVQGCGTNCGQKCSNLNSTGPIACPLSCLANGCNCKKGFYKDENLNKCVEPQSCTLPCTKPNTVFSSCVNGGCSALKTCKDLDTNPNRTIVCVDPIECKSGCVCEDGYVEDDEGNCILENECPNSQCKGENEIYSACLSNNCFPKSCDELGNSVHCALDSGDGSCPKGSGCICRDGYLRNSEGKCIPQAECPASCNHDDNAEPGCGSHCGQRCSDYFKKNLVCPLFCLVNGCNCKEGFVFDDNTGKCVNKADCTPVCGMNEEFSTCANGCSGPQKCSQIKNGKDEPVKCSHVNRCLPGCLCKAGYLRNEQNICVPKKECKFSEKCDGVNEYYDTCAPYCSSQACSSLGLIIDCAPQSENQKCVAECRCADGYFRNRKGTCVLEKNCPEPPCLTKKCPADEVFDGCINGGCFGPRTCKQYTENNSTFICVDLIANACVSGCKCRDNWYRNDKGKCVPSYKCVENQREQFNSLRFLTASTEEYLMKDTCPLNEVLNKCINGGCHGPRTCSDIPKYNNGTICAKLAKGACKTGCVCKDDWVRNDDGVCVPQSKCLGKCSKNEVYDECNTGCPPRVCGTNDAAVSCLPANESDCSPGCRCQDGYSRNVDGDCIPTEQCPSTKKCCSGVNEELTSCIESFCRIQNCSQKGDGISCAAVVPDKCTPACVCKEGYLKDVSGQCISQDQCPSTKCSKNEVYDECNTGCPPRVCGTNDTAVSCLPANESDCSPGCRCQDGYSRNVDGDCIPTEQCPPTQEKCLRQNEIYVACPDSCDPRTCESIGQKYNCPLQTENKICRGECQCKPDYYRNHIGDCIAKEDCLKCQKKNEYFSCGGACDNICARLSQYNQTNCPIVNIVCNKQCYCFSGYARDVFGECVLIEQCRSCPGEHEWFNTCPSNDQPETCEQARNNPSYSSSSSTLPAECHPECRCEDDYVRDQSGTCILKSKCPCGNDPNAIIGSGCGVSCDRLCSNYNSTEPIFCTDECKVDECDCKPGYFFNELTKTCVLAENCLSSKCSKNEIYDECNTGCPPRVCGTNYAAVSCLPANGSDCSPGCRCQDGYSRNVDGDCIPTEQCPPTQDSCSGINEELTSCIESFCRIQNCSQKGDGISCAAVVPDKCTPACVCKEGYLKDVSGQCVSQNQCPSTASSTSASTSSPGDCNGDVDDNSDDNDYEVQLGTYINDFSYKFMKETAVREPNENFIVSTFNLELPFYLLTTVAKNNTQLQLLKTFDLPNTDPILKGVRPLLKSLADADGVTLANVMNIYISEQYSLSENFAKEAKNVFNSTASSIDCSDPKGTAKEINNYVENNTDGKITNLISEDSINSLVRMIIVNAIYFKGSWKIAFDKDQTQPKDFHTIDNQTIQMDTMYLESKLNYTYSSDLQAQVCVLYYKDPRYKFVIVLPDAYDGLPELIQKMNTTIMDNILQNARETKVKLYMPTFEFGTSLDLKEIFIKLGISDLFNENAALVGILNPDEPLYVSAALHKAYIKVTEDGTVAAAATSVGVRPLAVVAEPKEINIIADHPFFFAIYFKNNILFSGTKQK